MNDGVKFPSGNFIATEDSFAEFGTIKPGYVPLFVAESEVIAECREDTCEGPSSWLDSFASEDVGVYDRNVVLLLKEVGYGGFASRNTPCQPDN
jgi:hypothetical protein